MKRLFKRISAILLSFLVLFSSMSIPTISTVLAEDDMPEAVTEYVEESAEPEAPIEETLPADPGYVDTQVVSDVPTETEAITDVETEAATEAVSETTEDVVKETTEAETKAEVKLNPDALPFNGSAGGVEVYVSADPDTFPVGTTMVVIPVQAAEVYDIVNNTVAGDVAEVKAVDITFYGPDGAEVQPLKPVHMTMTAPGMDASADKAIVHIDDNNSADVIGNASISGNSAVLNASSFSKYIFTTLGESKNNLLANEPDGAGSGDDVASYLVTFKVDDEILTTISVNEGEAIGENLPQAPEKENYTFDGWFSGDTEITAETVVSAEITASASYSANFYSIKFWDDENGDGTYETLITEKRIDKSTENPTVGTLPEIPFIAGKQFKGWVDSTHGGTAVTADTPVTGDMDVYALFDSIHLYTVEIQYYYTKSDTEDVIFDRNIISVDGRKISEHAMSIESPSQVEVVDEAVSHHDAENAIFYPSTQTVVIDSDLLNTAVDNKVTVRVEYVPYTAVYTYVYRLRNLANTGWDIIETEEVKGVLHSLVTPTAKDYHYATLISD